MDSRAAANGQHDFWRRPHGSNFGAHRRSAWIFGLPPAELWLTAGDKGSAISQKADCGPPCHLGEGLSRVPPTPAESSARDAQGVHDRRRVIHFNVTAIPTSEWAARQIGEAFPWDSAPHYLVYD